MYGFLHPLLREEEKQFLADPKYPAYKGFALADISDCGITLMYLPLAPDAEPLRFRECAGHPMPEEDGFVLYCTDKAECARPGDHIRPASGRKVCDPEHPVRQEVSGTRGNPALTNPCKIDTLSRIIHLYSIGLLSYNT